MPSHKREILLSLLSAIVAYLLANAIESAVIGMTHPSEQALTWISDAVLAVALGVVTYLWLHLMAARSALSRLERTQIKLDAELSMAAEMQRNLLPELPAPQAGIRWAARLQPAEKIGGDFYDFVQPDKDTMLVLLVDISGKGIPAALLLASVRTLFRTLNSKDKDPGTLVHNLAETLFADNGGSMYMTCLLGTFDLKNHSLTYTNAGHPPGVILRASERKLLETGGVPAGMFPGSCYESKTIELRSGDIGVFFTDGISEAIEEGGIPITDVLQKEISKLPSPLTPELVCERTLQLADTGKSLNDNVGSEDDQTVVAFLVD
jgi:serine phosphatase RsbU (regulator of sigma subunit)